MTPASATCGQETYVGGGNDFSWWKPRMRSRTFSNPDANGGTLTGTVWFGYGTTP